MNIQETLLYFRKQKRLPQRELLKYTDSSVYSKIESGKKNLKFYELLEILNTLSIPLDEFSKYFDNNTANKVMRDLFERYKQLPSDLEIKKDIITYFKTLYFSRNSSLEEISNYIVIKTLFSNRWKEIPPLSQQELADIFILLDKKKYYFHYDYAILSNTIYLFNDTQIEILLEKTFPVKDMQYRNAATKEFITNLICNLITTFIRKKDYKACEYYMKIARQERENYDLSYKIMLNFLENLIVYVQTKDTEAKNALENSINFLNSVGESNLASSLKAELESILLSKEPIIILRNHFNRQY